MVPALPWPGCKQGAGKDVGRLSLQLLAAPTASQMAMLVQGTICPQLLCTGASDHLKSNPSESPTLPTGSSSHLMGFPSVPFVRYTHTHRPRHAHSSPGSGRGPQAVSWVHGQPGSSCLPLTQPGSPPGEGGLQWPSVTDRCDQ